MSEDDGNDFRILRWGTGRLSPAEQLPATVTPATKPDERYRLGIYPLAGGQDILMTRALFDLILSRLTEATQNEQRALAFRLKNTVECGGDV